MSGWRSPASQLISGAGSATQVCREVIRHHHSRRRRRCRRCCHDGHIHSATQYHRPQPEPFKGDVVNSYNDGPGPLVLSRQSGHQAKHVGIRRITAKAIDHSGVRSSWWINGSPQRAMEPIQTTGSNTCFHGYHGDAKIQTKITNRMNPPMDIAISKLLPPYGTQSSMLGITTQ